MLFFNFFKIIVHYGAEWYGMVQNGTEWYGMYRAKSRILANVNTLIVSVDSLQFGT